MKFFITPSKKNVKAFLLKIRKRIKESRSETAAELISDLNPLIRGWAMYHRHVESRASVSRRRSCPLPGTLGLGTPQTPQQAAPLDKSEILLSGRLESLGIHRHAQRRKRADACDTTLCGFVHPHPAAYENPRRGQPARPDLGTLLREATRLPYVCDTHRETAASLSVERTSRSVPCLPAEDHQDHWLAQSPHSLAIKGRIRWGRKPRLGTSNVPSANPQPGHLRRETASGNTGGMKGLSRMWRNPPVRFLGEGWR
jgi:hypothetical protein